MSERRSGKDPLPEFPPGADSPPEIGRRDLLKLLGASASLAGLGACMERPLERILPRTEKPPELTPDVPLEYSTSMVLDGFAIGLIAQSLEARPIKIEGNPEHPASLGATTAYEQASLYQLYDPDREGTVLERGVPQPRTALARQIAGADQFPGLWFLLHPQSSPLVAELVQRIRQRHPGAQFVYDTPLDRRAVYQGAQLAFGRPLEAQYDFRRAEVVLSLDADFLSQMPMSVRWAREFAAKRRLSSPSGETSRLYVVEPAPSPSGSLADHAIPTRAGEIPVLAAAVLAEVARAGRDVPGASREVLRRLQGNEPLPRHAAFARAVASDLVAHAGRGLVLAGDRQPPETHLLAHVLNAALGNIGATVSFTEPALLEPLGRTLADLAEAAEAGEVQTLVILEANPVYTAPADLDFERVLSRVPLAIHGSIDRNETSKHARWFVPLTHYLESWGDARAYDGTRSLIQPLIRPLKEGYSVPEMLALFAGDGRPDGHELLRDSVAKVAPAGVEFETFWAALLRRGFLPGSGFSPQTPSVSASAAMEEAIGRVASPGADAGTFEIYFVQSPAVYDGRFADNGWLQEMPKPLTKLTWGNAALMSPDTARRIGVSHGDLVRLELAGREIEAPALPFPGCADDAISVELGYGRRAGGELAEGVGFDAYQLRTRDSLRIARGLRVTPTGGHHRLATTQEHWRMHGRELALHATLDYYREHPDFTKSHRGPQETLLPDLLYGEPQWAMSIDTMICTGCSACVIACQAENNIPIVGKEGVLNSREMHWLRIDTYFTGGDEHPQPVHQPMLCQHCEQAPCEYVCPVYATQHSPDGLNEMVYNRCIGTRFCSNNCPYKVRRFNWFDYTEDTPKTLQLQRNPNVTVRGRGVMEKCTYCVQRIRRGGIEARLEGRAIEPGQVVTACQQACPTGAIQFGTLQHEGTEMVKWRRQPRQYAVLHELGTRPRTLYLAKITNPNPALQ